MKIRSTLIGLAAIGLVFASPLAASAGTTSVHAKLSGASVVPGPGDDDAKGKMKVKIKDGELCFKLKVKKAGDVTGLGLYQGAAGEVGALLVALEPPTGKSGCTTIVADDEDTESTLSESEAAAIGADPSSHYAQVATDEYPDGAVRGQFK